MTSIDKINQRMDRLDQQLEQLHKVLQSHSHEALNHKPGPERWSAMQNLHHLIRAEGFALKYLKKKLSFDPKLGPITWKTRLRGWVASNYLSIPIKVKAPKAVREELPDNTALEEVMGNWKSNRSDLRTYLNQLPAATLDKEIYKHPMAGRLSLYGMLDFMQAHVKRHTLQIDRTIPKK